MPPPEICVLSIEKVNNWPQEMHAITPHIVFEHIKGKNNVLADSLWWLRCLGLQVDNGSEEPGQEYGKSIFETDENIIHSLNNDQIKLINLKLMDNSIFLTKNDADNTHPSTTKYWFFTTYM